MLEINTKFINRQYFIRVLISLFWLVMVISSYLDLRESSYIKENSDIIYYVLFHSAAIWFEKFWLYIGIVILFFNFVFPTIATVLVKKVKHGKIVYGVSMFPTYFLDMFICFIFLLMSVISELTIFMIIPTIIMAIFCGRNIYFTYIKKLAS